MKTITGFVRKIRDVASAVTESSSDGSTSRLQVCSRVVTLNKPRTSAQVPVKVFNLSAKVVTIQPKATLCELQEVTVLRSADITQPSDNNTSFLSKWQTVFSQGPTDLGHTKLVQHSINLEDDRPFKEPYRNIPPALIQEAREHLREMIEIGAIRESSSPYNVVIVRKKDGTFRFCIDYRKLNSPTVRDAYAIPRIDDTLHLLDGIIIFSSSFEEHLSQLDSVLTRLQAHNLKLKPSKCEFF